MKSWLLLISLLILMLHEAQGRNGKFITRTVTHISSSDTMFKNDKTEGNKDHHTKSRSEKISVTEENLPTNSSLATEKQQPVPEPYPDILDIAGMDYSQARRKPPIHN